MNLKQIQKCHTIQLEESDCGVACILSILKYYGANASVERIRELSGTTNEGTSLLGLYQAANQLGFDAEGCESDLESLIAHLEPVILHVIIDNKMQHYVVCYGYDSIKGFLLGDPAKSIYYLSKEELDLIWITKTCLTLKPNKRFTQNSQIEKLEKKWFLHLLEPDYKFLWISILLGIFVAGLGMSLALFSQKLIDEILPSRDLRKLVFGILLLSILLFARVGFSVIREYFLMMQAKEFNIRINSIFVDSILRLPKPFFDTRKTGELIARLNDTQRIQRVIKLLAGVVIVDLLVILLSFFFLFIYSFKLGFIAIVVIPFYYLIINKSNIKIIEAQKDVMQTYAYSESNYINTLQGISTIKNHNKEIIFKNINDIIFSNFQGKVFNLGKVNLTLSFQSGIATVFFLIGILVYTSILVYNNELKLGELMAILGIVSSLLPSIANLALISIPINEAKIAFKRMYEFSSLEKERCEGSTLTKIENIDINNISFRFAGRRELFKNLTLQIEKGKFIAIVGESGSGKSTLGQILQRFYKIEEGTIKINKKFDLTDIKLENYRSLIGVIPQEIAIFNGTVYDNIILGEEVESNTFLNFTQQYGFDKYFNELPQGLATIIGEGGINLSGGQKQTIGLARALFKKPQFLILDEATSAMDRKAEKFCLDVLKKVNNESLILFISHRLNSLKDVADVIYVIENNTIKNYGNHQKLLETKNFYSDYFK